MKLILRSSKQASSKSKSVFRMYEYLAGMMEYWEKPDGARKERKEYVTALRFEIMKKKIFKTGTGR